RPHLRALRLRLRVGRARRILRRACGPDRRPAARDRARRVERSGLERRGAAADPPGRRVARWGADLGRVVDDAGIGVQRGGDLRAHRAGRLLPHGLVPREWAAAGAGALCRPLPMTMRLPRRLFPPEIGTRCALDLMRYLYRHPNIYMTVAALSMRVGYPAKEV